MDAKIARTEIVPNAIRKTEMKGLGRSTGIAYNRDEVDRSGLQFHCATAAMQQGCFSMR